MRVTSGKVPKDNVNPNSEPSVRDTPEGRRETRHEGPVQVTRDGTERRQGRGVDVETGLSESRVGVGVGRNLLRKGLGRGCRGTGRASGVGGRQQRSRCRGPLS